MTCSCLLLGKILGQGAQEASVSTVKALKHLLFPSGGRAAQQEQGSDLRLVDALLRIAAEGGSCMEAGQAAAVVKQISNVLKMPISAKDLARACHLLR